MHHELFEDYLGLDSILGYIESFPSLTTQLELYILIT